MCELLLQGLADKKLVERRAQLEAVDKLKPIAEQLGCTLAQLALAW
jgi:aryl-alcohol dehydrogenase-like predicted oxidoreductase